MSGLFPGVSFIPSGSVLGPPGLAFAANKNVGFYYPTSGYFGLTVNGASAMLLDIQANVSMGINSLQSIAAGAGNTALGTNCLFTVGAGSLNTFAGSSAGISLTTGSNNTGFGVQTLQANLTGSGNVALGYRAGFSELGSNALYISNSSTATPLIKGSFDPAGGALGTLTFTAASQTITDGINSTVITPAGVMGINNSSTSPSAGVIGELIVASVLFATPTALVSTTPNSIASIVLTPGVWDVNGFVGFVTDALSNITELLGGIAGIIATLNKDSGLYHHTFSGGTVPGAGSSFQSALPQRTFAVTVNTTMYLTVEAIFSAGTVGSYGRIYARRVG